MRSSLHAGASNSAYHLTGSAQTKSSSSPRELAVGENSINDVIRVTHVSAEIDLQRPSLDLIYRRPERNRDLPVITGLDKSTKKTNSL